MARDELEVLLELLQRCDVQPNQVELEFAWLEQLAFQLAVDVALVVAVAAGAAVEHAFDWETFAALQLRGAFQA